MNLLSTRIGRLAAFFFLYVTEGVPLGFTAVAMATQMRRGGVDPAQIGAFVATLYLPWSFKFVMGPVVDVVHSDRLGRRRGWIVGCQIMMILTLLATTPINLVTGLTAITWIIFAHNVFGATQDVAIDALACESLKEHERGLANGLMFAGAYIGNGIGGAGILFLIEWLSTNGINPQWASFYAAGAIAAVMFGVSIHLKEPERPRRRGREDEIPDAIIINEVVAYGRTALKAFFASRSSIFALVFALLPAGAYSLSLALQTNLAVEFGLTDKQIGWLSLWSTILAASGCVIGGLLSDYVDRRRVIAVYILLTALPAAFLAFKMQQAGWIMPIDVTAADRPKPSENLLTWFWSAVLVYNFLNGLMYGTRTALFMDICTPEVAATQFTAYMSLLNLVIAYSAWWQGWCITKFGYPTTLKYDALFGCLCLCALPWMTPRKTNPEQTDETEAPT